MHLLLPFSKVCCLEIYFCITMVESGYFGKEIYIVMPICKFIFPIGDIVAHYQNYQLPSFTLSILLFGVFMIKLYMNKKYWAVIYDLLTKIKVSRLQPKSVVPIIDLCRSLSISIWVRHPQNSNSCQPEHSLTVGYI